MLSNNRHCDSLLVPQKNGREIWHVQALLTRSTPANRSAAYDRMLVLMKMLARDSQQLRNLLLDVAARYEVRLVSEQR